jgi:hypothetical protein
MPSVADAQASLGRRAEETIDTRSSLAELQLEVADVGQRARGAAAID